MSDEPNRPIKTVLYFDKRNRAAEAAEYLKSKGCTIRYDFKKNGLKVGVVGPRAVINQCMLKHKGIPVPRDQRKMKQRPMAFANPGRPRSGNINPALQQPGAPHSMGIGPGPHPGDQYDMLLDWSLKFKKPTYAEKVLVALRQQRVQAISPSAHQVIISGITQQQMNRIMEWRVEVPAFSGNKKDKPQILPIGAMAGYVATPQYGSQRTPDVGRYSDPSKSAGETAVEFIVDFGSTVGAEAAIAALVGYGIVNINSDGLGRLAFGAKIVFMKTLQTIFKRYNARSVKTKTHKGKPRTPPLKGGRPISQAPQAPWYRRMFAKKPPFKPPTVSPSMYTKGPTTSGPRDTLPELPPLVGGTDLPRSGHRRPPIIQPPKAPKGKQKASGYRFRKKGLAFGHTLDLDNVKFGLEPWTIAYAILDFMSGGEGTVAATRYLVDKGHKASRVAKNKIAVSVRNIKDSQRVKRLAEQMGAAVRFVKKGRSGKGMDLQRAPVQRLPRRIEVQVPESIARHVIKMLKRKNYNYDVQAPEHLPGAGTQFVISITDPDKGIAAWLMHQGVKLLRSHPFGMGLAGEAPSPGIWDVYKYATPRAAAEAALELHRKGFTVSNQGTKIGIREVEGIDPKRANYLALKLGGKQVASATTLWKGPPPRHTPVVGPLLGRYAARKKELEAQYAPQPAAPAGPAQVQGKPEWDIYKFQFKSPYTALKHLEKRGFTASVMNNMLFVLFETGRNMSGAVQILQKLGGQHVAGNVPFEVPVGQQMRGRFTGTGPKKVSLGYGSAFRYAAPHIGRFVRGAARHAWTGGKFLTAQIANIVSFTALSAAIEQIGARLTRSGDQVQVQGSPEQLALAKEIIEGAGGKVKMGMGFGLAGVPSTKRVVPGYRSKTWAWGKVPPEPLPPNWKERAKQAKKATGEWWNRRSEPFKAISALAGVGLLYVPIGSAIMTAFELAGIPFERVGNYLAVKSAGIKTEAEVRRIAEENGVKVIKKGKKNADVAFAANPPGFDQVWEAYNAGQAKANRIRTIYTITALSVGATLNIMAKLGQAKIDARKIDKFTVSTEPKTEAQRERVLAIARKYHATIGQQVKDYFKGRSTIRNVSDTLFGGGVAGIIGAGLTVRFLIKHPQAAKATAAFIRRLAAMGAKMRGVSPRTGTVVTQLTPEQLAQIKPVLNKYGAKATSIRPVPGQKRIGGPTLTSQARNAAFGFADAFPPDPFYNTASRRAERAWNRTKETAGEAWNYHSKKRPLVVIGLVGVAFYFALKGLVAAGIAAKRVGDKIVVKLKGSPEEQKAQKAKVQQIVQDAKSQAKYAAFDFTHKVQCHPTISVT
jgi:hypothetical protein